MHRAGPQRPGRVAAADATGLTIPYTTTAVVIAHTFVSLPFYVLSVEGALRASGERYDVVAATLGADRWTTFRRVTLPAGAAGGAGRARRWPGPASLGEFGATITFAGNYPGTTQTMPTLIYQTLQADPEVARDAEHDPAGGLGRDPRRAAQPLADGAVTGIEARRPGARPAATPP